MSVQYQRMIDEVLQSENSASFSGGPDLIFMRTADRQDVRWPKAIGLAQIVLGLVIAFFGLLEVFILPMVDNPTGWAHFDKSTCYGVGLYAGLVLVVTGSVAVRTSITRRKATVWRFYNLTVVTLLLYTGLTLLLLVAYSKGWTDPTAYPTGSNRGNVHLVLTVLVVGGLALTLVSAVHYFHVICFGDLQLWHWWTHCLCYTLSTQSETQQTRPATECNHLIRPAVSPARRSSHQRDVMENGGEWLKE
ncbi:uncharacterized protein LOC143291061 [Babylonia areolata]|uniref:uncharacterized protein LOC143291061 n=1 Tax=Babylonia areolata TaxID=304850 RepID=UPI003FCF94AB